MLLKKRVVLASLFVLSFSLLVFSFASASWYRPVSSPPFCTRPKNPTNPNDPTLPNPCSLPINASTNVNSQTKNGNLVINGDLTAGQNLFTAIGNGTKVTIGSDAFNNPLPTAILDVAGQIRIRGGGCPGGLGCPAFGRVLTPTVNSNGLATWTDLPAPVSEITTDQTAILFCNDAGTSCNSTIITPIYNNIKVNTTVIQRRLTGTGACPVDSAMTEIKEDGTFTCLPLVSSLTTIPPSASGLSAVNMAAGAVALNINTDPNGGLITGSSPALLKVNPPASNSGLIVSSNYLQFATSTSGCGVLSPYWKSNGAGWACSPRSPTKPGGSILNRFTVGAGTSHTPCTTGDSPVCCPTGWADLGVQTESVGASINTIRTCKYASTPPCQAMYLPSPSSNPTPPSCPSGWTGDSFYPTDTKYASPGSWNWIRPCYKCN